MKQAVDCDLFLYANDSCLVQHKDVKEIERKLNKNFSDVCYWFVDNKLSIHFGEDKAKCMLFGTKHRLNKVSSLDIKYSEIYIKQYHTVTYLGCSLDETLSRESMALKVINNINSRLRFLYRKNRFLPPPLRRLLCNSLIKPYFDYTCSACYTQKQSPRGVARKGVLKICSKFTREHSCGSAISIKLFCKFAAYFQNTFS